MLEIRKLSVGYSGEPVLRDVSMEIPLRGVTAILGPNGCGKSTFLKTICGILEPMGGRDPAEWGKASGFVAKGTGAEGGVSLAESIRP